MGADNPAFLPIFKSGAQKGGWVGMKQRPAATSKLTSEWPEGIIPTGISAVVY